MYTMNRMAVMTNSTHCHTWFDRNDGMHSSMISSINVVMNAVDAVELYSYTRPLLVKNSANKPIAPNAYPEQPKHLCCGTARWGRTGIWNEKKKKMENKVKTHENPT